MPQISQLALVYQSQWFWLLLTLGAIFFFVGRGIVPKVEATVDARDGQIAGDLAAAKAARDAADAVEADVIARTNAARADAQAVVTAAKAGAAKAAEARLAAVNAANEARLVAAEAEIASARSSAMAEIEAVASEAAADLVNRLTGKTVSAAAAASAVKAQIDA